MENEVAPQIVNLTPHSITVLAEGGEGITFPPSGKVARVSMLPGVDLPAHEGAVPLRAAPQYGAVTELPAPAPGTIYIVSGMVSARACRADVFSPDTGPDAVRETGQIVAVRRLVRSI